jgi:hypothetical protein
MPKELHDRLARQAAKQGLTGDRKDAYVYGTMNKVEHAKKAKAAATSKALRRSAAK